MKKASKVIFNILFILILVITVLCLGYSPLRLKDNCVGVLISKTNGVCLNPIEHGQIRFDWQLLIPTNATVRNFNSKNYQFSKNIKSALPSSDVYSKMLDEKPDFSYSFMIEGELAIKSNEFVTMVTESKVTTDSDVEKKLQNIFNDITEEFIQKFITYSSTNLVNNSNNLDLQNTHLVINNIKKELIDEYKNKNISIVSLNIKDIVTPDFSLYIQAKQMYNNYLSSVNTRLNSLVERQATEIAEYTKNLSRLEKFAKVLKENPELADFLKTSKDLNETLKTINSF